MSQCGREEIEHEANMAVMELDLANSGRENSDFYDYHNIDFEDDDPLFSSNEDVSESSGVEEEEPSTSHTSVSQQAEYVGIQETTNKTGGRGRPSKIQKTSTEGANDTFTSGTWER
ncbi:hypothetical protein FQA39_LY00371 [Lamprigera yunnana]|nr:hypothetical protein FQA39_LY00371 [Lamprigera yunnana]